MSNIWNKSAINSYLETVAEGNEDLLVHLKTAIAKPLAKYESCIREITEIPENAPDWLVEKWEDAGPWHEWRPSPGLDEKVNHIRDWIKGAIHNEAEWMAKTDPQGRPHKLLGISTIDQAKVCADRAMHELSLKYRGIEEESGDTTVVKELDNGFAIVELLTPAALKRESGMMSHCIGEGGHDEYLGGGKRRFYSLRDANNNAHVTFDIDHEEGKVIECKGKANAPPIEKYMPYAKDFIIENEWKLEERAKYSGLIEIDGTVYDIRHLPSEDLTLTAEQYLELLVANQTVFPENVMVNEDIHLSDDDVDVLTNESAPVNLEVKGDIKATSPIHGSVYFADNLTVHGDFIFEKQVHGRMPKNTLVVHGVTSLSASHMDSLPPNTEFKRNADLTAAHIEQGLPKGIIFGDGCDFQGSNITRFPDNAVFKGEVATEDDNLGYSQITSCGNGITIRIEDITRLDLHYLKNTTGLTIFGDVDLYSFHLMDGDGTLPDGTIVHGNVEHTSTQSSHIPEGLMVYGDVNFNEAQIDRLPDKLTYTGRITLPDGAIFDDYDEAKKHFEKEELHKGLDQQAIHRRDEEISSAQREEKVWEDEELDRMGRQWDVHAGRTKLEGDDDDFEHDEEDEDYDSDLGYDDYGQDDDDSLDYDL